jgi:hypothetical protein
VSPTSKFEFDRGSKSHARVHETISFSTSQSHLRSLHDRGSVLLDLGLVHLLWAHFFPRYYESWMWTDCLYLSPIFDKFESSPGNSTRLISCTWSSCVFDPSSGPFKFGTGHTFPSCPRVDTATSLPVYGPIYLVTGEGIHYLNRPSIPFRVPSPGRESRWNDTISHFCNITSKSLSLINASYTHFILALISSKSATSNIATISEIQ